MQRWTFPADVREMKLQAAVANKTILKERIQFFETQELFIHIFFYKSFCKSRSYYKSLSLYIYDNKMSIF
jgi:hypothetical protein